MNEAIELSSDDSNYSSQSANTVILPEVCIYSAKDSGADTPSSESTSYYINEMKKNRRKSVDSHVETSTSKAQSSQNSGKKRNRRKSAGSMENVITKKTTAAERQALKKKLAEEKKAINEANKIYKPGECMKHMTVEMHPVLLESWYCADVMREIGACGGRVKASSALCDPALVLWSRATPPTLINNLGKVELTPSKARCGHGLYVYRIEEVAELVSQHTLADHLKTAQALAGCKLTLVLFGVKDYFKTSGRKTANSGRRLINEVELEKAITDLLVSADCDTVKVNTPNELALTILHYTKAIAEEPYKKAKREIDEQAEFYMRGDNKKCVAVDKDGHGLSRVWQQMIAVLPLASLESSRAICAQYPTPLALFEALQSPSGVSDVANIGVTRAALAGAKARRAGPEFAKKLDILFTSTDGNTLLS